jgi:hypothetical protein
MAYMEILYVTTTITIGNGRKTPFCHAPWLEGIKLVEVALILSSSKRKNWMVAQDLHGNAWVGKVDLEQNFSMEHLSQFVELWTKLPTSRERGG